MFLALLQVPSHIKNTHQLLAVIQRKCFGIVFLSFLYCLCVLNAWVCLSFILHVRGFR